MISWLQPAYALAGFSVGLLVGMTGIGGGSLMTPLLILFFGIHPATAVGTDLLFAATTKAAGTWMHGAKHSIDWTVVRRLATGSVPTTIVVMFLLAYLDIRTDVATKLITTVLVIALLLTAMGLIFRRAIIARCGDSVARLNESQVSALTVAVGCIIGVLVSLSSVGAGAIGVIALVLLYPGLSTARIVGSDIAHAVPLTLVAGIGHWILGSTDLFIFSSLIVGSIPGILLSSYLASRIPEPALRFVLATALLVIAAKLSFGLHESFAAVAIGSAK